MLSKLSSKMEGYREFLPKVKVPKVEVPKVPKVEVPKVPKVEVPKVPKVEVPKVEVPKVEVPKVKVPPSITPSSASKINSATAAQKTAAKTLENDGIFKTFAKNNSGKLAIAGVTAASLAIYMVSTGETDPAKALGNMVGEVASGVGQGVGSGIGAAASSLFDGLGLGPYSTYIQLGCAACSCLCCLLLVTYLFMQFKK